MQHFRDKREAKKGSGDESPDRGMGARPHRSPIIKEKRSFRAQVVFSRVILSVFKVLAVSHIGYTQEIGEQSKEGADLRSKYNPAGYPPSC